MVTIVMPCYNEAEIIGQTVREWHAEVISRLQGSELLIVDDCSTDQSPEILEGLRREFPALRWIRPKRNGGHGKALLFGFGFAQNKYVFQTDSDRQHLPTDFWKLWNLRADADFVFGVRQSRADGAFRVFITTAMRVLNFFLWGEWVRDANCPFKLMKRQSLVSVLQRIPSDAFIPMVMIALLSRKMGYRVAETEVIHLARRGGTQSLRGLLRWARVSGVCLGQLLALRLALLRSSGPTKTLGAALGKRLR